MVVKAIQHLYGDKEKVKLPVELLGKRKTVLQKKKKKDLISVLGKSGRRNYRGKSEALL